MACNFAIGSAAEDPLAEDGEEAPPAEPVEEEPAADDPAGEDPADELEVGDDPVLQPLTTNAVAVRAAIIDLCTTDRMTNPFVCEGPGLR